MRHFPLAFLILFSSALLVGASDAVARGPAEVWEQEKAKAAEETVAELAKLARSCKKGRAFLQRDQTYEAMLVLDPDNKTARKGLGWTWNRKEEQWVRRREYRAPKDKDPEAAREAREQRGEILGRYRDLVLELMDSAEGITPKQREAEIDELLRAYPDDEVLRETRREVRGVDAFGREGWILQETEFAIETRREFEEGLSEALGEIEVEEFEPDPPFDELGVEWKARRRAGFVKVYCATSAGEAEKVARYVHVVYDVLPWVLGGRAYRPHKLRVYVMSNKDQWNAVLANCPDLEPNWRKTLERMGAAFLDSERLAVYSRRKAARLDFAVSQACADCRSEMFGSSNRQGWISHGLNLYLTFRLIGTRLSNPVAPDQHSTSKRPERSRKIRDEDTDLFALTREMLEEAGVPKIPFSIGKDTNAVNTEDLMIGYALGAYLVEGHPPRTIATILSRCSEREASLEVLTSELGMDPATIEKRLRTWLGQVRE